MASTTTALPRRYRSCRLPLVNKRWYSYQTYHGRTVVEPRELYHGSTAVRKPWQNDGLDGSDALWCKQPRCDHVVTMTVRLDHGNLGYQKYHIAKLLILDVSTVDFTWLVLIRYLAKWNTRRRLFLLWLFIKILLASELHAGPNFGTRPDPRKSWPDPTRSTNILGFLDPTRPMDHTWWIKSRKAFKFVACNKQL